MRLSYRFILTSFFLVGISSHVLFGQGKPINISSKSSNSFVDSILAGYPLNSNANDISGNGNNGTVDGQTPTTDRFGRADFAYQFTTASGGIQTPSVEQPDAISLWFQTTSDASTLLSWGSGSEGVYGYTINVLPTGIEFVYNSGDGVIDGTTFGGVTRSGLNDGNWHHLVIDIDQVGELLTFYVDNEEIGTDLIDLNGILWVGINSIGLEIGPAFDGKIDNVFLYSGNIFPSEVNSIYHSSGWDIPDNSLVLNYDFNDSEVEDLSGFGFNNINVLANSVDDRFNTAFNALSLNGIDEFCETSGVPLYENISVSAWFNTSADFSGGYRSFVDLFGLGALSIGPANDLEGTLRIGSQDFLVLNSNVSVNDGLWHHAALTYNGNSAKLYLDNELVHERTDFTGPLFLTSIESFLNVGFIFEPGNTRYFDGLVDDINYYNYGISQAEVISLYTENNWPNTAPIARYPFNGNAFDESGNFLDGSVLNATLTADRFENSESAYNFNGSNSYVAIANDPLFDLGQTTDLSISGWFRTSASGGVLFDKSDGQNGFFVWFPPDGTNRIQFLATQNGVGTSDIFSQPGYNDGQWHHIVVKLNRNGGMSIHIDGVLDSQDSGALSDGFNPDNTEDFLIGAAGGVNNAGLNNFFNGELDDFKIFKSLLSEQEIRNLYSKNAWPNVGQVQITINQVSELDDLDPFPPGNTTAYGKAFDFTDDQFQIILNGAGDRPYGDSNSDGFIDLLGSPIVPPNGLHFVRLTDATRAYQVDLIESIGFLGSARTGDDTGWLGEDTDMVAVGNGVFELNNIQLFDGEWKIRANNDWNFVNWGSSSGSPGELLLFQDNIPIAAGTYDITVDLLNSTYSVTEVEPTSSLQANYFFNNNFNDDSGNANDGTGINASFGNDRFGSANQAATFNGSDAYVSIPNSAAFNFGTSENIVISGWFRTTSSGILFDKSNFLSGYFAQIDTEGKLQFFMVQEGGSSAQITTNGSFNDGNWHHYVIQIDRIASMEIFIDGELEVLNEDLTDGINPDMAEDFLIGVAGGVDNAGLNSFFQGAQDDIQIFNQTLTLEEIQALYAEGGWPIIGTPRIASISPRSAKSGADVTISGINFANNISDNIVSFNGIRANVLSATSTELRVSVPLGASYGPIYVHTNGQVAQSTQDFNVVFDGNGLPFDSTLFESSQLDLNISSFIQGALLSADFDQDGNNDLGVLSGSNQFSLLRNSSQPNGDITFAAPIAFSVSSNILKISKGDFDGDGKWDIAVAHSNIVSIFRNTSSGAGNISFENIFEITVNGDFIRDLEVGDMNGDGYQDLVLIESVPPVEEFGQTTYSLTAIGNNTENGIVNFSIANSTSIDFNFAIKLRDFNGDRKADVVTSNSQVFVNLSNFQTNNFALAGPSSFTDIGTTVEITTADYDADGKQDFAVVEDNGGRIIGVFANSTTNPGANEVSFIGPDTLMTGQIPTTIKSADFNGDGKIDIATVDLAESLLSVYQNKTNQIGDLMFSERTNFMGNLEGYDLITSDFNNDGKTDIITSDLVIYENKLQSAEEIIVPESQATNLNFTDVTASSMMVNYSAATNHDGNYLVIRNVGSSSSFVPQDGISYQLNDALNEGRVAYVGKATSFIDSLLNQDTRYFYSVFTFNGSGAIALYLQSNPLTGDEITLPLTGLVDEPTAQPEAFEVTNFDDINKSFQVNYTAPADPVDGYLVVRKLNDQPAFVPSDGQVYNVGEVNNMDSVVYVGPNTQFLEQNVISDNQYQYLVFSYNGTGSATNYLQLNPLAGSFDVPSAEPSVQPTSFTVNSFGPNSVNFSFSSSEEVSGFIVLRNETQSPTNIPEDFESYAYGDQINDDVVIYSGASRSVIDINLNPQTQYFYAVFAFNGSDELTNYLTSGPLTGSITTAELPNLATAPAAQATNFEVLNKTENSAELGFTVSDAEGYLVVRSESDNNFFVPADGINYSVNSVFGNASISYIGQGNSWNETNLSPLTTYNYRVFAFNGSGNEINYLQNAPLQGSLLTLTTEPNTQASNFAVSERTFTSFKVSFDGNFDDADGYLVIRTEGETPPANVPIDGLKYSIGEAVVENEVVVSLGTDLEIEELDLNIGDTFSYAIYSFKGDDNFINYNTDSPLTGTASALEDNTAPLLQDLQYSEEVELGDALSISVTVVDEESGVDEVEIQYLIPGSGSVESPITESMQQSGDTYSYEIPNVSKEGIEFRIVARNALGLETASSSASVITTYSGEGLPIPYTAFGTEQSNYRIISVPMSLNDNSVDAIFGSELGNYGDLSKWRMFRYSGESTSELSGTASLIPGRGYWLIVSSNDGFSFSTGSGKNVDASVDQPYEIVLSPGWNQIGNPYTYDVSWSDVQELNGEEFQLRVFNGSFSNGNTLSAFSGGFVNWPNSSDFTLRIPRLPVSSNANRQATENLGWELNMTLEKDGVRNELAGIGMSPMAKDELDVKDQFNLPKFLNYINLKHDTKANGYHVLKDIASMHSEYNWTFDIESNLSLEGMSIRWEMPKTEVFDSQNQLVLWDPSSANLIDMKTTNQYQLRNSSGRRMQIIYGSSDYVNSLIEVSSLHVSEPFPNPSNGLINLQVFVPEDEMSSEMLIELFNLKGTLVSKMKVMPQRMGQQTIKWDIKEASEESLSGVYLLRVSNGNKSVNKKIIMK